MLEKRVNDQLFLAHKFFTFFKAVRFALDINDGTVMQDAVEDSGGNGNIISTMAKQAGVTEALKAIDQMEWVDRMNSVRNRAEEIILHELVYA